MLTAIPVYTEEKVVDAVQAGHQCAPNRFVRGLGLLGLRRSRICQVVVQRVGEVWREDCVELDHERAKAVARRVELDVRSTEGR